MEKFSHKQKMILTELLLLMLLLLAADLFEDVRNGVSFRHIILECFAALLGALGILTTWNRRIAPLERALISEQNLNIRVSEELAAWKASVLPIAENFSKAVDDQFALWELTPAESETALLLLKGLSLREIADVRGTSEKTVKQHNQAIYQKSGMKGRAELSAYFLEDLLGKTNVRGGELGKNRSSG